jgi:hypothetical protein
VGQSDSITHKTIDTRILKILTVKMKKSSMNIAPKGRIPAISVLKKRRKRKYKIIS